MHSVMLGNIVCIIRGFYCLCENIFLFSLIIWKISSLVLMRLAIIPSDTNKFRDVSLLGC
jgi:hypothetical protein